jgi:hypothetical protein
MTSHRNRFLAGALAAGLLAAAAPAVIAQTAAPPAPGAQRPAPHAAMRMAPNHRIDGRVAFLKAELKITDAQAPAFEAFAKVLRQNAAEMAAIAEKRHEQRAQQPQLPGQDRPGPTAIERLERRAEMSKAMAAQNQRYLDAFKPLYNQLSAEQKKTADELVGGRGHRGHRRA